MEGNQKSPTNPTRGVETLLRNLLWSLRDFQKHHKYCVPAVHAQILKRMRKILDTSQKAKL